MRKFPLFCWLGVCASLQLLSSVTAYSRDGHPYHITKAGPVKGLVTSADGKPLQGVTVSVKGRKKATVTDADVALGRIDPNGFAGGSIALSPEQAAAAIAKSITLDMTEAEAAKFQEVAWKVQQEVNP